MLKYVQVELRVSELHTLELTIPQWEIPLLQSRHLPGSVTTLKEVLVNRAAPEADAEYTRLADRYKAVTNEDGSKGLPLVATVYGQFGVGQVNLQRAIQEAFVAETAKPVDVALPPNDYADLLDAATISSVGG